MPYKKRITDTDREIEELRLAIEQLVLEGAGKSEIHKRRRRLSRLRAHRLQLTALQRLIQKAGL